MVIEPADNSGIPAFVTVYDKSSRPMFRTKPMNALSYFYVTRDGTVFKETEYAEFLNELRVCPIINK